MKKLLILLMFLTLPSFAVQVTTNRYAKELNDKCAPKISVNNNTCDFITCLINQSDPEYYSTIWRDGWSQYTKANVYKLFASIETQKPLSLQEERLAVYHTRLGLKIMFSALYTEFFKTGLCSKKMPAELVKTYRGY